MSDRVSFGGVGIVCVGVLVFMCVMGRRSGDGA